MKTFHWLLKREFWENRGSFLWAPIVTGGVFLLLNLMGVITAEVLGARHGVRIGDANGLQRLSADMDAGDLAKVGTALDISMYSVSGMIALVLGFVVLFYCLGALYNDRHDRSILFWKSLPISDTQTVLSKLVSAVLVAPLIAIVTGVIAGLLQLLLIALVLAFHGIDVWRLLLLAHPFKVAANLIGSIPLYALWATPAIGWFLLCSAWARSKPFLWALLLPLVTGVLVSWFRLMGLFNLPTGWFWSHVVLRVLGSEFPGTAMIYGAGRIDIDPSTESDKLAFLDLANSYRMLGSAELWVGVAVGIVLIIAAVWFRRVRDDS
jgi:ABC-2 type transport system permease protein